MKITSLFKPKKPLILLVDDDPRMREVISEMLTCENDYEVITANDGFEALYLLDCHERGFGLMNNRISVVVLDIKMPHMDGVTCLKRWRTIEGSTTLAPPMFRLPILFLSAYEDLEKWQAAVNVRRGCLSAYLKKPIKKLELLHTLKRILVNKDLYSMQEELFKECWNLK